MKTRNKSKHADLLKLSPFLFQKSRQLHQAGVRGVAQTRFAGAIKD